MHYVSPRACFLLDGLLLAFNTLKKLVEGIGKLLHAFILELLCNLVVVDADFLKGCQLSFGLRNVVLNGTTDSSMIAKVLDRLKWHCVHGIGTDQLFGVEYITIGRIFRACASP